MKKLSFILPIYNVEKFIPDCLSSLLSQDLGKDDYEIICIDDGSTDDSLAVCNSFAEKYSKIKVIHQENAGVSVARNNGLKVAEGKYVWFVDPDDYIRENCIGSIYNQMEKHNADFCSFLYTEVPESGAVYNSGRSFVAEINNGYNAMGSVWQYVIRKGYLINNHITFNEELKYGEDYLFAFQLAFRKHVALSIKFPLYFYRQRKGSAMHGEDTTRNLRHRQDMFTLAKIYRQEYDRCKNDGMEEKALKNINRRVDLCIQGYLLDTVLHCDENRLNESIEILKKEGFYPYKIMWWHLFNGSIQCNIKVRLFVLLFPYEKYLRFVNKKFGKKNG